MCLLEEAGAHAGKTMQTQGETSNLPKVNPLPVRPHTAAHHIASHYMLDCCQTKQNNNAVLTDELFGVLVTSRFEFFLTSTIRKRDSLTIRTKEE